MLSKALVVGAYQRKLAELARLPDIELTAVVPPSWRDRRGTVSLQRVYTDNYRLVVAPLAFNGQYHLHFYPTLGRLLRNLQPDILHVDEEPYNMATWQALRIGASLGAAGLFFTWQNLPRRYPWPFAHFERVNFQRARHAIAGNQAAVQVLRGKGYRGPVSVIPQFGVDPEHFSPAAERARGGPFVIGYAGGLVPEKGIDLLLQACARLAATDWSLLILGEGPERQRLEALAAGLPSVARRIHFLGHLPSMETPGFYRQLDVLVLPSRSQANWTEQFGRVLIEAMACGVPVVGAMSGEIPQVIGDAGLVFPEGDVAALADRLSGLAADPAQRTMLAGLGRARVLAHYTQAQVAAETYEVYRQMVAACV